MEMKHPFHAHSLILNENYIPKERDVCTACCEEIVSCRLFIYSCSDISKGSTGSDYIYCDRFLLHRTCAEAPHGIENPFNPNEFLVLSYQPYVQPGVSIPCDTCNEFNPWRYICSNPKFCICFRCAILLLQDHSLEDCKYVHAAHSHHPLVLIQRPSSFHCDICQVKDNFKDMSYKCTKCLFWMHKSCGDAPTTFQFHFHRKHPLILAFSLPEVHQKFVQYCRLCSKTMSREKWLYYCPKCRFFAHFQCARSSPISSSSEDETFPNLVHLPAADESSVNLLVQHFVKDLGTLNNNKNNIMFSTTDGIKHWAHDEHLLKLITVEELNDQKTDIAVDDEILLLCDGCALPIGRDCDQFYACVPCKYFLHKFCAELPKEIEPAAWPGRRLFAEKCNEPYNLFVCMFCGGTGNGIFFTNGSNFQIHIRCAALPKRLKHEIHPHPLTHIYISHVHQCRACGHTYLPSRHGCDKCSFYICDGCIMNPSTVNHRWDSHPLHLIYEAGMVTTDHEHEFSCEYCSHEIDTNWWFYHCSVCDLSFHPDCFKISCYRHYSDFKFGVSEIFSEKLHPHNLTFVLNKKVRNCKICGEGQHGEPVLECAPCRTIFCRRCSLKLMGIRIAARYSWSRVL